MLLISIDGVDLAGKTSLADALGDELRHRGLAIRRCRTLLARHHPLRWMFDQVPLLQRQADSSVITALFLAAHLFDHALVRLAAHHRRRSGGEPVVIWEGTVDRCVAAAVCGGAARAATWALAHRRWFLPADLGVVVHAPTLVRARRLSARPAPSTADARSVTDARFAAFTDAVITMAGRHARRLILDSSRHSPRQLARIVCDAVLAVGADSASRHRDVQ